MYGCYGCGDGYGIIEPDKLGELGLQMLTLGKLEWYQENAKEARGAIREARRILEGKRRNKISNYYGSK